MGSTANVTTTNVELTPMRVTFGGVDLGGTSGGVKVSAKHEYSDIMVDQFGKTPVDAVLAGQAYSVKMVLAETKKKDNWKVAFPSLKLVTSGGNKMLYADAQVGDHLLDRALELVLHPLSKGDADKSGDFKFFKAVAKSAVEIEYGPDKQTGLEIEFIIMPDQSTTPARFFVHGDPSIGLVAASVGTPSFTGTGDGTLSGLSAGLKTVTETITLTCVGAETDGGKFYVAGSVSGPLGLAVVGTPFVSDKINLTIEDGATDFEAGDVFTVATTAANYA